MKQKITIFWFRRDLRLVDNAGLYKALSESTNVLPIFIFDRNILDELYAKDDARVAFIYNTVSKIHQSLVDLGSGLQVYYDTPIQAFNRLVNEYDVANVYTNTDYEPYATTRDTEISDFLSERNIAFNSFKDHVIFEKDEIVKDDGGEYKVFTPYSRTWKAKLNDNHSKSFPVEEYFQNLFIHEAQDIILLSEMGFEPSSIKIPSSHIDEDILETYGKERDYPALESTSRLGIHLRFGTISIRKLLQIALKHSETFVNELIWRDFYQCILWHYPKLAAGVSFKEQYDLINWEENEKHFKAWCEGKTGYPLVDAGMRQLNATGFMHNRVRMVTASFLTKHLLINWRLGEAYFAEKLLDFDFAANNGGWQWCSGSGVDGAPYFRVFNPTLQAKKFDPKNEYIKKWVPEFGTFNYPQPIVNHEMARKRCLERYKEALDLNKN
jgi:deoxyribodipyrimidine photo-lyase